MKSSLIPGDGEVDECGLGLHLGLVVRVGQFGLQDQSEGRVVLHLLVTHLDVSPLLDGVAAQERIQHGVHGLTQVFQQHHVSVGHGMLDDVQVASRSQADDLESSQTTCSSVVPEKPRRIK